MFKSKVFYKFFYNTFSVLSASDKKIIEKKKSMWAIHTSFREFFIIIIISGPRCFNINKKNPINNGLYKIILLSICIKCMFLANWCMSYNKT